MFQKKNYFKETLNIKFYVLNYTKIILLGHLKDKK